MSSLAAWLRLQSALRLLGSTRRESILAIGYGDGSYLPELARRARHLAGIECNGRHASVMAQLADRGVRAELRQASVRAIPFADETFSCAVAIHPLEAFAEGDLDAGCREIRRVLQPGGELLWVASGPQSTAAVHRALEPGGIGGLPVWRAHRAIRPAGVEADPRRFAEAFRLGEALAREESFR